MATNRSVDRALDVLGVVATAATPPRFVDLATLTGIPKATLHSLVGSLESAGFLDRTPSGYRVGIRAFEIGTAMPLAGSLRRAVAPVLDRLASDTREACHFGTLAGSDVVYLDRRDTGEGLRLASRVGQRLPAHATGLGKAMLATFPDAQIMDLLPAHLQPITSQTVTERSALLEQLAVVRQRGYAIESEESTPGVCCIGMVAASDGVPLGISVSVPVQRMGVDQLPALAPVLSAAAEQIQRLSAAHLWLVSDTEGS